MALKKLINQPDRFVEEFLEGVLAAHPELTTAGDPRVLVRADAPQQGKVGIVTGGGSGHLPLFLGYVGPGLCSAVAVGNVFSSPSAEQILAATRAVDGGAGVLYLYGNYGGDVMNFDDAAEMADEQGIRTRTVLGSDDVASAGPERAADRRGVAGLVLVYKCAGAAAESGAGLDEVAAVAEEANAAVRTMGIGLSPTIFPATGQPSFELDDGEMEVGIGIHGEPGVHRGPLAQADSVTDQLLDAILADLQPQSGDEVAVLVNGLGATPLEELYVIFRRTAARLQDGGIRLHRAYVGEYATSLEMAGASVSVMALSPRLRDLLATPASSPFFRQL